jgi:hypothetical protein
MVASWKRFLTSVANCIECKRFAKVRAVTNAKAWNGCEPPDPRDVLDFARPRVFFISEAPPGGVNQTFFYCDDADTLRQHLFEALRAAKFEISALQDFYNLNCYLLPSFCYPCGRSSLLGANSHPDRRMVEHSATRHLRSAIDYIQPSKTILLGERAAWAARAIPRPCFVTYWPTKRSKNYQRQWRQYLVRTLRAALTESCN